MGSTPESLRAAVKRLAYQTSVAQLKRRGVDKVKVLGLDHIAKLIQEAVSRSMSHKMASVDRRELAVATRDEFLKLLESNQNLARSHDKLNELKQQAEVQVDQLRRELAEKSAQLKNKLMLARRKTRAQFDGEDAVIAEKIQALFDDARSGPGEMKLDNLRGRVMELILQVVNDERGQAIFFRTFFPAFFRAFFGRSFAASVGIESRAPCSSRRAASASAFAPTANRAIS